MNRKTASIVYIFFVLLLTTGKLQASKVLVIMADMEIDGRIGRLAHHFNPEHTASVDSEYRAAFCSKLINDFSSRGFDVDLRTFAQLTSQEQQAITYRKSPNFPESKVKQSWIDLLFGPPLYHRGINPDGVDMKLYFAAWGKTYDLVVFVNRVHFTKPLIGSSVLPGTRFICIDAEVYGRDGNLLAGKQIRNRLVVKRSIYKPALKQLVTAPALSISGWVLDASQKYLKNS